MPLGEDVKQALREIIKAVEFKSQGGKNKRFICTLFMEMPDKEIPNYYDMIPHPRSVNMVKHKLEEDKYDDPMQLYEDLSLVFWNAIYYNEEESVIAKDASKLKLLLDDKWNKDSTLPPLRSDSPPPTSAQKMHAPAKPRDRAAKKKESTPFMSATAPRMLMAPPQGVAGPSSYSRRRIHDIDGDVDISGISDAEDHASLDRDPESEQIVSRLEKGLPKWPGFTDQGWWEGDFSQVRLEQIVHVIKSFKDIVGNKLSIPLDAVPEEPVIPYLASNVPVSLKSIDTKTRAGEYTTTREFDLDFGRLFDKAKKFHGQYSDAYGGVMLLQRLYNALTSSEPPSGPPYSSTTNFASLAAGPGNVKPVFGQMEGDPMAGVTSHRVIVKDRTFVDELHYKGWTLRLADWVHLANPDDPSQPIVAQIFRLWVNEERSKKGQQGITVSWYYRPSQTFHPASRPFYQNEVFKTSHFAEHPLEDLLEKIAVQFTARHVRGRPRAPYWWPGFPLYVCDSRYNDREKVFVRIKNWASCIPEEVRKNPDWMPIYPFERAIYPVRLGSPFLKPGGPNKPPGGLLDLPGMEGADHFGSAWGQVAEDTYTPTGRDGPLRKRTKRNQGMGDVAGPTKGAFVGSGGSLVQHQQSQQPYYSGTHYQSSSTVQPAQFTVPSATTSTPGPSRMVDRSITGNLGNWSDAKMDILKLPNELTRHFDRDPDTGEMLWFSTPPVNTPKPHIHHPKYSMEYLHFMATKESKKRKAAEEAQTQATDFKRPPRLSMKEDTRQKIPLTVVEVLQQMEAEQSVQMDVSL
ncbi:hypothetical protein DL96DRAFT_1619137 [Flagelloscypha sp. PMI_526]|nr:hypothetical protein DL96DRAFT_1619137 [Flagelloscypha sp. PMI_526]